MLPDFSNNESDYAIFTRFCKMAFWMLLHKTQLPQHSLIYSSHSGCIK